MAQYEVVVREVTVKVYYADAQDEEEARIQASEAAPHDFDERQDGSTWEVEEVNLLPEGPLPVK